MVETQEHAFLDATVFGIQFRDKSFFFASRLGLEGGFGFPHGKTRIFGDRSPLWFRDQEDAERYRVLVQNHHDYSHLGPVVTAVSFYWTGNLSVEYEHQAYAVKFIGAGFLAFDGSFSGVSFMGGLKRGQATFRSLKIHDSGWSCLLPVTRCFELAGVRRITRISCFTRLVLELHQLRRRVVVLALGCHLDPQARVLLAHP